MLQYRTPGRTLMLTDMGSQSKLSRDHFDSDYLL